jgi:hypothetical protein
LIFPAQSAIVRRLLIASGDMTTGELAHELYDDPITCSRYLQPRRAANKYAKAEEGNNVEDICRCLISDFYVCWIGLCEGIRRHSHGSRAFPYLPRGPCQSNGCMPRGGWIQYVTNCVKATDIATPSTGFAGSRLAYL